VFLRKNKDEENKQQFFRFLRIHDTLVFVLLLFLYVHVYYLFRVSQIMYVLLSVKAFQQFRVEWKRLFKALFVKVILFFKTVQIFSSLT
jgi:hypothetical protein